MDALSLSIKSGKLVEKFLNSERKKENFQQIDSIAFPSSSDYKSEKLYNDVPISWGYITWVIFSILIGILIGVFAAYLSWKCNSKLDYHIGFRIIFSIFAYIFGLIYIILYFTMRWDVCQTLKEK